MTLTAIQCCCAQRMKNNCVTNVKFNLRMQRTSSINKFAINYAKIVNIQLHSPHGSEYLLGRLCPGLRFDETPNFSIENARNSPKLMMQIHNLFVQYLLLLLSSCLLGPLQQVRGSWRVDVGQRAESRHLVSLPKDFFFKLVLCIHRCTYV